MRSVAKAALWLLLFIWAAAAFQEIGAEAEAFALEQFSSCGEAVLADVGSALSDIAYLPAHNILMTVSAGSGDIIIRAHSLSGARQIEMDVSLGGAEGRVAIAAWGNAVAAIDAKGTIRQSGFHYAEEEISSTEVRHETIQVFDGLAHSGDCECFYIIGGNATYKGVYKVSAETGAVIETSLRPIAKIPGTPSSLHAFRTAADEPGLLVLDSEDGVIYKVGTSEESREGAAPPEPIVRLADLMGRDGESGGLGFEPAGITMKPDGSLLAVAARDGRVFHFCADPKGRPTAEEAVTSMTPEKLIKAKETEESGGADVEEAPGAGDAEDDTTLNLLLSISGGGSKLIPPKISLVADNQQAQGLPFPDEAFLAPISLIEDHEETLLPPGSPGTTETDQEGEETPKNRASQPQDFPGFRAIPSSLQNRDPMLVEDPKFDVKRPMIDSIPELP